MQSDEYTVVLAREIPTVVKTAVFAGICVGVYYSVGNWLSTGGYVLAALLLWLYWMVESVAVENYNSFMILKKLIEIKVLESEGTIEAESCLTNEDEKDTENDDSSTE